MRPYTELPGLGEVVLEESYVLAIRAEPGVVSLDMDFVLTTNHPAYTPPPRSEAECFRRGVLRLTGVERLRWDGQGRPAALDASGEIDFGHVDSFEWENGRFVLAGDWGLIDADAQGVEASLAEA
jgi:hypothetical protein